MQSITEYRQNYTRFIEEMDTEIGKAAEGFVRIGYLLKVARDTDVLASSEYESVNDMAKKRYGLDKTQVSRFININDRFSEGGNSDCLAEHYRGFGSSKLSIMLLLPDAVNEELTPEYSKAEIQALKEEIDAENKISDLEVLAEDEKKTTEQMDDILSKAICQLGEDDPELFCQIFESVTDTDWCIEALKEIMVPNKEKMYSIRIQGVGRVMLSMKDTEDHISLINIRTENKIKYSWGDLTERWEALIDMESNFGAKKEWERIYGKDFPEKEEVAPVQPKQRKESKVTKANVEKPVEKKEPKEPKPAVEVEELQGQMKVDDYKEVLPDEQKTEETFINVPEETEKVEGEVIPTPVETEDVPKQAAVETEVVPTRNRQQLLINLHASLKHANRAAVNGWFDRARNWIKEAVEIIDYLEELK